MNLDDQPRTEFEAAIFRRLVARLRARAGMQNATPEQLALSQRERPRSAEPGNSWSK